MSGQIDVTLGWNGRRVCRVELAVRRPQASRLLLGKPAAEAVALLPRLYRLCGKAQAAAARLALVVARGEAAGLRRDEQAAVLVEQIQEHLWRLLRDWPRLLGLPAWDAEFAHWYRQLAGWPALPDGGRGLATALVAFLGERVLGGSGSDLDALGPQLLAEVQALVVGQAPLPVACSLPATLGAAAFAAPWPADFAALPTWQGQPAATGVGAAVDLPALLRARLVALAVAARQLQALAGADEDNPLATLADALALPDNGGLARVATARGILLHRLQLRGELSAPQVASYDVVAPTEWNFHPQGVCAGALATVQATDESTLRRLVAAWLTAFDPCVGWQLTINKE